MIKVFNGTDNTFSSNGDVVLNPTRAIVHKEDNGSFYLDLETNLNEETKIVQSEEGSTITINGSGQIQNVDTTKEVELTQVLGNTTQNGTPTPTTPIPISNVSGLQEADVVGKNFFDKENIQWYRNNSGAFENTTDTSTNRIRTSSFKIQGGKTYKLSGIPSESGIALQTIRTYTQYGGTSTDIATSNNSFTLNSNVKYIHILFRGDNLTSATNTLMANADIMLNEGTSALPYEPYKGNTYEINLGKNLLDIQNGTYSNNGVEAIVNNGTITLNGTATGTTSFINIPLNTPIYVNGYFTISANNSFTLGNTSTWAGFRMADASNNAIGNSLFYNVSNNSATNNISNKVATKITLRTASGLSYNNNVIKPQYETGTQATSYSPYFTPIELNKISTYKDFIFKGKGINLANPNNLNLGQTLGNTGNLTPSATRTTLYQIEIKPNTLYSSFLNNDYQIGNFFFYDRNKTYLTQITSGWGNNKTFTSPNNAYYVSFATRKSNDATMVQSDLDSLEIQIEKGNKTTYEPYNAKDKWLLHKEIGKVVINGTENYTFEVIPNFNQNRSRYTIYQIPTDYSSADSHITVKSNLVSDSPDETQYPIYDNTLLMRYIAGQQTRFDLMSSTLGQTTVAGFKTWLASNNLIVYYVLNTPTTTEITNSELLEDLDSIELLDGLNNIMITSSDLPATLDIHYNYVSGGEVKTSYIDYLVANNILVANTPQGNQAFRITNVDKSRSKIRLQANHIFYDSQNYIIKDSYVVEKNCNEALDHLNNATDSESPFTTLSDVNTIESYRCVRKSLYEAIQVILERWGGHLVRDNFEIKIMDTIGSDNQVVVRYGKNLKNIEAVYDWNAVATKLMPVGADGLLLPEEWLYANNSYEIPYTKVISFDQSNINQEDYADDEAYQQALIDDLRQKGNEYLATNSIPMVNYTLDANLEKISDVGDTIEVIDERLGINLLTHLISFDYNCLLDRYEQLQFGNFTPKLNDLMSTISESTTQAIEENNAVIKATLSDELTRATDRIWQALGSSYIIYDGDKILVLDQLPKESAQNVIMINSGGIGFSNTGIDGTFTSAWTIDNILNMENINVINLTADLIRGGILKLGSNLNQYGQLEIYNEANDLIAEMNKDGFKMYGQDGSYILINNQVGLSGYDRNGTRIYWADGDAFHMKKSEVEEEITLCGKMRYIPIQISSGGSITNDGIGLVSVYGGE